MDKKTLKAIYDGQQRLQNTVGHTLEEIHANYGYDEARYKEANRNLNYGYKEGFTDAILYIKNMTPAEREEFLKNIEIYK